MTWKGWYCGGKFLGKNAWEEWLVEETNCAKGSGYFTSKKWNGLLKSKKKKMCLYRKIQARFNNSARVLSEVLRNHRSLDKNIGINYEWRNGKNYINNEGFILE